MEVLEGLYGDDRARAVAVAKLVPAMTNLSRDILEEPSRLLSVVSGCRDVHAFTREIW
jgi:hypothetical protein